MTDCVLWHRYIQPNGYGQTWRNGRTTLAHRAAYEDQHGRIPEGMVVMHSCDNPPCVNVAHLRLGTQGENRRDAARKGRTATGERNGVPRSLTAEDVRSIRSEVANGPRGTTARLARQYGVSSGHISGIVSRVKYGWVT